VLDRGKVALEATRDEVKSAEELIRFMEDIAHPTALAESLAGERQEHVTT
jgi:simple sugar transport system ATP-binding protein